MNELHQDQDSPTDAQVSRLYRQYSSAEPSLAVDRRVLAAARAALADRPVRSRGGWQRWRTPLALATTLALSLTLALLHERPPAELDDQAKGRGAAEQASPKTSDQAAPAEAKRESLPTAPVAEGAATGSRDEARLQSAPPPAARAAAPELAKSLADRARSPTAWLEEIRALRREGKVDEAERQLREFRRAHPGYALPDDFRQ